MDVQAQAADCSQPRFSRLDAALRRFSRMNHSLAVGKCKRDTRSTFACVLMMRRALRTWLSHAPPPLAEAWTSRGGRPGIWTLAYPDEPTNRELEIPSGSLLFKSRSAGAGGDPICPWALSPGSAGVRGPRLPSLYAPFKGRKINAALSF